MLIHSLQYQRLDFQKQPVISGAPVSRFLVFFHYTETYFCRDTSEIKPLQCDSNWTRKIPSYL